MRLAEKKAIITGAASGIGRATAIRLAEEGAEVLAVDISAAGLEETRLLAQENGLILDTRLCDVSSTDEVTAIVSDAAAKWGRIDIMVNIAGIQVTKPLSDTSWGEVAKMLEVNLGGVFLFTKAVLPHMERAGGGAIVNLASELAFVGYPELSGYTATKGAVVAFTRSVALEGIKHNVRINCVCPGATDTPIFWEGVTDPAEKEKMLEQVRQEKPCGRLITPLEVANGIVFMASDEASGIAGTSLVIDGGFIAQ